MLITRRFNSISVALRKTCPALPCPAGQGRALSAKVCRAQDRAGHESAGRRAGQGKKKCPVDTSGVNHRYDYFLLNDSFLQSLVSTATN